jgi:hypothetical protein
MIVWATAVICWSTTAMKEAVFFNHIITGKGLGYTKMSEHAVEAPINSSAISLEINAHSVLGLSRSYPSTLPGTLNHSNICQVFSHVNN